MIGLFLLSFITTKNLPFSDNRFVDIADGKLGLTWLLTWLYLGSGREKPLGRCAKVEERKTLPKSGHVNVKRCTLCLLLLLLVSACTLSLPPLTPTISTVNGT